MRVLFVSNLYPPNVVGGYEELCHEVASRFAARGHEVAVLTSCYGGRTQPIPGQVVHQSLRLIVGRTIYDGFDGPPSRRALLRMQMRHRRAPRYSVSAKRRAASRRSIAAPASPAKSGCGRPGRERSSGCACVEM